MEKRIVIDRCEILGQVDRWFIDNNRMIEQIMEANRSRVHAAEPHLTDLDLSCRILSEMPICWSLVEVAKKAPLPGFRLLTPANGYIEVTYPALGYAGYEGIGHGFFINEDLDLIACLTFGQVVLPMEENWYPWEKVNFIEQIAPELVVVCGNLAMLRGDITEIKEKLGLIYRLRRNYE